MTLEALRPPDVVLRHLKDADSCQRLMLSCLTHSLRRKCSAPLRQRFSVVDLAKAEKRRVSSSTHTLRC